jgi:CBS domain-containing protein
MLVSDLMTHTVATIDVDTTVRDAAEMMRDFDIGFLPVTHEEVCAGVLTDRDIVLRVVAEGLDPTTTTAGMILPGGITRIAGRDLAGSAAVASVPQDATAEEALQRMEDLGIHRLAVHNDELTIIGVISLTDLHRHAMAEMA